MRIPKLILIVFILSSSLVFVKTQFLFKSLVKEYIGQSTSYQRAGGPYNGTSCNHGLINAHLNWKDMSKFATCFVEIAKPSKPPKDYGKSVEQIIIDHGYNFATYHVTSSDGYIQTVFRITGGPKSPPRKGKPSVLLFHGASLASDIWFLLDDKSFAFVLADGGYEVWLPNARGSTYSRGHVTLNYRWDLSYWDFSYHEIAVYDIPLYVDLILTKTSASKIFYIGYSMGATVYPAAVAESPQLNDKIHASFLLGGGFFSGHSATLARFSAIVLDLPVFMQNLINKMLRGRLEVNRGLNQLLAGFCSATALTCGLCGNALFSFTGHDFPQMNYTRIPDIISRIPNTASFKFWLHTGQNYRSCKYQKFDYGPAKNLELYGQRDPPEYNLQNVHAPIYIYYGEKDDMTPLKDLKLFRDALPKGTVQGLRRVNWKKFNHFDFMFAKDANVLLYNRILQDMDQYV